MNAPTAMQSHTTPKTPGTTSAVTATSTTPMRIDTFLKQKLAEARSGSGYGIVETTERVKGLGFTSSANARYSEFLEQFRDSTHLTTVYQEAYPSSIFLPWKAFHALIKAMDLRVDLPEFYLGAVPEEQLPWMEIFELQPEHIISPDDVVDLLQLDRERAKPVAMALSSYMDRPDRVLEMFSVWQRNFYNYLTKQYEWELRSFWAKARDSFFVVAPPEAFSTKHDWLKRFKSFLSDAELIANTPPDDPLVIRFCRGGAIVVAAWGDEAAFLNRAAQEVGV